jgi:large subunit ribosomal protein L1
MEKKRSKRYQEVIKKVEPGKVYLSEEAIAVLKEIKTAKFDETVELSCRLGVDLKKGEQVVRGTAALPHGTGKKVRILALVNEAQAAEAKDSGADFVGLAEYVAKISGGWTDFDCAVTTPDCLKEVARLGKILGPRGLMPSPKNGTVTTSVSQTIKELKAGRVEFRMDKGGNVHLPIGKLSFEGNALSENLKSALDAINASSPGAVKGQFLKRAYLSTTMGPSLPIKI